jgi:hypothetical protein
VSTAADIVFIVGVLLLVGIGTFQRGIRHAYDRWVDHRDHLADNKRTVELQRVHLLYGQPPEVRQNSTTDV